MSQQLAKRSKSDEFFNVYVVEEHNDALSCIYKEIGARHLKFSNLVMIHFDSHPDMGIPVNLNADLVFSKDKLFENLSIENWIIPAVYAGHIETLVWVKPKWAAQIDPGQYKITVGKDPETGCIRCDCKQGYFLSESLYANEKNMTNKRELSLYVCDYDSMLNLKDSFLLDLFSKAKTGDKRFMLDVDLDFFSTKDPFKEMFSSTEEYDLFKSVYFTKFETQSEDPNFDSDFELFLNEKKVRMEKLLNFLTNEKQCEPLDLDWSDMYRARVENFVQVIANNKLDLEIVHSYGCGLDEIGLPHNVTSESELKAMLDGFDIFLSKYFSSHLTPSIVTIARSSLDGYCPLEQVEFIQEQVISKIKSYFKSFVNKIEMDY
jgi:hypothetical protein